MSESQAVVSTVVRFAMIMRRETLADLSDVLGVSRSGVSNRLNGHVPWSVPELDALAEHYGLTPAQLVSPPAPIPIDPSPSPVSDAVWLAALPDGSPGRQLVEDRRERARARATASRARRGAVTHKYPRHTLAPSVAA